MNPWNPVNPMNPWNPVNPWNPAARSLVVHARRRPSRLYPVGGASPRVDVDHGQLVRRGLHDVAVESGRGRARPNRWAGLWLVTPVAARPARRRGRGS